MNAHDKSSTRSGRTNRNKTWLAALISLGLMFIYVLLMPATELWDRDEPLYARTAIEMLKSGDWFLPSYNGALFAHKPPLTYLFMALSFSIFGENEFAARFVSGPSMAGAAFLTYLIARQMFDHVIGMWSMIIFGTSVMTFYLGSIAQHDGLLMLFVMAGLYAYVSFIYAPKSLWPMLALFTIALTITLYIKGPVGPAVLCSTLLISWLLMKQNDRPPFFTMFLFALGLLVALALFAIWLIPANSATDGALVETGVGKHIIQRFQAPLENYGGTAALGYYWMLPAYIPVILIGFLPWTIHLPAGLSALIWGTLAGRREHAILWGWIVPTFIMFTLAGSKLPHYIFPVFPALAIISAAIMVQQTRAGSALPLSRLGAWLYLFLSPGLALGLIILPFMLPKFVPFWLGIPAGLILLINVYLVFKRQYAGEALAASRMLAAMSPLIMIFAYWAIVPRAEPMMKISKDIGDIINDANLPKDNIYMQGYLEPSMVFYINAPHDVPIRNLPDGDDAVAALLNENRAMVLIAKRDRFNIIQTMTSDTPFEVLGTVSAINTNANLENQDVVVGVRR